MCQGWEGELQQDTISPRTSHGSNSLVKDVFQAPILSMPQASPSITARSLFRAPTDPPEASKATAYGMPILNAPMRAGPPLPSALVAQTLHGRSTYVTPFSMPLGSEDHAGTSAHPLVLASSKKFSNFQDTLGQHIMESNDKTSHALENP